MRTLAIIALVVFTGMVAAYVYQEKLKALWNRVFKKKE